ncbi:Nrap_family protein [Hexamita inflata]|uniref:Nrap family protein n=1 Tax=Hexamita inflata TaxID=28002 RepID=A0AA86TKC2_9EUKA|nr:Nrap family protein [Hexamita inflata]
MIASVDEQQQLRLNMSQSTLFKRQLQVYCKNANSLSVQQKLSLQKAVKQQADLLKQKSIAVEFYCAQLEGSLFVSKSQPIEVYFTYDLNVDPSDLIDRQFFIQFTSHLISLKTDFELLSDPYPQLIKSTKVDSLNVKYILIPSIKTSANRFTFGASNIKTEQQYVYADLESIELSKLSTNKEFLPSMDYNYNILFNGQMNEIIQYLKQKKINFELATLVQSVFIAHKVNINTLSILLLTLNYQEELDLESQMKIFITRFVEDFSNGMAVFGPEVTMLDERQTNLIKIFNQPALIIPTARPLNALYQVSHGQMRQLVTKLDKVKYYITNQTNYINNKQITQFYGQNVFAMLLNKSKFIVNSHPDIVLNVNSKLTSYQQRFMESILQEALQKHLEIVNFVAVNEQQISIYMTERQTSVKIFKGPNVMNKAKAKVFENIFKDLAEPRHFQNGDILLCVISEAETATQQVSNVVIQLFKSHLNVAVNHPHTSDSLMNKILPNFKETFEAHQQITQQIIKFGNEVSDAFMNPKVNFTYSHIDIISENAMNTSLTAPIYEQTQKPVNIQFIDVNMYVSALAKWPKHYPALVQLKQLLLNQLIQYFRPSGEFKITNQKSTYFEVQCFIDNKFFMMRVFMRFEQEYQLLSNYNPDKATYLQQLHAVKAKHVEHFNNSSPIVIQTAHLCKRWLAAHLVPLYTLDFNPIDECHSIFDTRAFKKITLNKNLSDFLPEEIEELFKMCDAEINSTLRAPMSDLSTTNWVNEEFVELLVLFLFQQNKFNSAVNGFCSFLQFIGQADQEFANGVILNMMDVSQQFNFEEGTFCVLTEYDPSGFLSNNISVNVFKQVKSKAAVCAQTVIQYQNNAKINPLALFKTSVKNITHILVLTENVHFKQFDQALVVEIDRKTAAEMEPANRFELIQQHFSQKIANLLQSNIKAKSFQQVKEFKEFDPLTLLMPIFARMYNTLEVKFDIYGGMAVYLSLPENVAENFDLDKVRVSKFDEKMKMMVDEQYLIAQGLIETGIFQQTIVQKNRWEMEDEIEMFEEEDDEHIENEILDINQLEEQEEQEEEEEEEFMEEIDEEMSEDAEMLQQLKPKDKK